MRYLKDFTPQALLRGVFLCLALALHSCEDPPETPDWPDHSPSSKVSQNLSVLPLKREQPTGEETVFMFYNLKNYLSMPRSQDGKEVIREKPENEIEDLVETIVHEKPDILAVCEIGTKADLMQLQDQLKLHGLELPHSHLVGGADAYRRQAILSKLPLIIHSDANIKFQHDGKRHIMLRGILDVSVDLPFGKTRFVGAHLKSKRKNKFADQAMIRRHEAHLVREHVNKVIKTHKQLIVFGDFNDTKQSPSVRAIAGDHGTSNYLTPLRLTDKSGQSWTHFWKHQDIYSRFDYVCVSPHLKLYVDSRRSYLPEWNSSNTASDHRPLVVTFR